MNKPLKLNIQQFGTSGGDEETYKPLIWAFEKTYTVSNNNNISSIKYKVTPGLNIYDGTDGVQEFTISTKTLRHEITMSGRAGGGNVTEHMYIYAGEIGSANITGEPTLDFIMDHTYSDRNPYIGYHIDWKSVTDKSNWGVYLVAIDKGTQEETTQQVFAYDSSYEDLTQFQLPKPNTTYKIYMMFTKNGTKYKEYKDTYVMFTTPTTPPEIECTSKYISSNLKSASFRNQITIYDGMFSLAEVTLKRLSGSSYVVDRDTYEVSPSELEELVLYNLTANTSYNLEISVSAQLFDEVGTVLTGSKTIHFETKKDDIELYCRNNMAYSPTDLLNNTNVLAFPHSTYVDVSLQYQLNSGTFTSVKVTPYNSSDGTSMNAVTFTKPQFRLTGLSPNTIYYLTCSISYSSSEYGKQTGFYVVTTSSDYDISYTISYNTHSFAKKEVTIQFSSPLSYANLHLIAQGWTHSEDMKTWSRVFSHTVEGDIYERFYYDQPDGSLNGVLLTYKQESDDVFKGWYKGLFTKPFFQKGLNGVDSSNICFIVTKNYMEDFHEPNLIGIVDVYVGIRYGCFTDEYNNIPIGWTQVSDNVIRRQFTENVSDYVLDISARVEGLNLMRKVRIKVDEIGQELTGNYSKYSINMVGSRQHKGIYPRIVYDDQQSSLVSPSTIEALDYKVEFLGIDNNSLQITQGPSSGISLTESNSIKFHLESQDPIEFTVSATIGGNPVSKKYKAQHTRYGDPNNTLGMLVPYLYSSEYDRDAYYPLTLSVYLGLPDSSWSNPYNNDSTDRYNLLSNIEIDVTGVENTLFSNASFDVSTGEAFIEVSKRTGTFLLGSATLSSWDKSVQDTQSSSEHTQIDLSETYYVKLNDNTITVVTPTGTKSITPKLITTSGTKEVEFKVIKQ